jgi:hypothetical protein
MVVSDQCYSDISQRYVRVLEIPRAEVVMLHEENEMERDIAIHANALHGRPNPCKHKRERRSPNHVGMSSKVKCIRWRD